MEGLGSLAAPKGVKHAPASALLGGELVVSFPASEAAGGTARSHLVLIQTRHPSLHLLLLPGKDPSPAQPQPGSILQLSQPGP